MILCAQIQETFQLEMAEMLDVFTEIPNVQAPKSSTQAENLEMVYPEWSTSVVDHVRVKYYFFDT